MSVAAILATLKTGTYTVTRRGAVTYDEDSREPVAGDLTTFTIDASIQPATGRTMKNLKEGIRTADVRGCWTATEIRTADEETKVEADIVTVDGTDYEVFSVERWSAPLAHYRAVLVKRDLQ